MSCITVDDDSSDTPLLSPAGSEDTVELREQPSTVSMEKDAASVSLNDAASEPDTTTATVKNIDTEDKPILELMKHLINYNGKQNSMLTNAQLISILKNEFEIDIANLHVITLDIYINVLKKFLKEWPQWDDFDRVMHECRCMNDSEEVEKMLEMEYKSLKEYLAVMLKACRPFARDAALKFKRKTELPPSNPIEVGDVFLEVNCTRNQLNTLFYRKPHPDYNNTIFNIDTPLPNKITYNKVLLKHILNGCHVSCSINTSCFKFKRELIHKLQHTLVNKKLDQEEQATALNEHLQVPKLTAKNNLISSKQDLKHVIEKILKSNRYSMEQQEDVVTIFSIIDDDCRVLKDSFQVPCTFRHFMNPYAYVRYLYTEVPEAKSEKYDIQLEEKISPRLRVHISKLMPQGCAVNTESNWLKLECMLCDVSFIGVAGIDELKNHFRDVHENEPDWFCTNCKKQFTAMDLAASRWYHKCPRANIYDSDEEIGT